MRLSSASRGEAGSAGGVSTSNFPDRRRDRLKSLRAPMIRTASSRCSRAAAPEIQSATATMSDAACADASSDRRLREALFLKNDLTADSYGSSLGCTADRKHPATPGRNHHEQ